MILCDPRYRDLNPFCFVPPDRDHRPVLENVGATDSDKRGELALCLLLTLGAVQTRMTGEAVRTHH